MLICSVDLETTGLDPEFDQILEVGAVLWSTMDLTTPVGDLPTFRCLVDNGRVRGSAFALAMNAALLRKIADGDGPLYRPQDVAHQFRFWALGQGAPRIKDGPVQLTCTGKNFASFDLQFLRRLENWGDQIKVHHRSIDVGSLYFDPIVDTEVPGMDECCRRAGLTERGQHDAVGDARIVIELLRAKWRAR